MIDREFESLMDMGMEEQPRPFKVGDEVVSTYFGNGVILYVDDYDGELPLLVMFHNMKEIWHASSGEDAVKCGKITHLG